MKRGAGENHTPYIFAQASLALNHLQGGGQETSIAIYHSCKGKILVGIKVCFAAKTLVQEADIWCSFSWIQVFWCKTGEPDTAVVMFNHRNGWWCWSVLCALCSVLCALCSVLCSAKLWCSEVRAILDRLPRSLQCISLRSRLTCPMKKQEV